ncbi:MAG TPA: T9SS type A sorting domain-containing protein [Ignavibacteria bacterium]|nr:T9SS type A sorting domain-containing protein [Ignavibacteria bacterium]
MNANTGYTAGASDLPSYSAILKTTDGGNTWFNVNPPTDPFFVNDIHILSTDTIWVVNDESLAGGVFFTSNGGVNWVQQFSGGNQNPDRIYMLNGTTGFMSKNGGSPNIYRTTNSGINWSINVSGHYMRDMKFADALTGWYSYGNNAYKTTNAGNNWIVQPLPSGGILITVGIDEFSILNRDTVYATGGFAFYGAGQFRGVIYRTINGGNNWLFQVPDTIIHIPQYKFIQFVNKQNGWAYSVGLGGIHTTNGGDTTFLVGVQQVSSQVPKQYQLLQNYPNPFNPKTNIKYQISNNNTNVLISVFDLTGKYIRELINQKQNAGTYEVDFDGNNLSSGVYFYKLTLTTAKEVFTETKRMVLIK